MKICKFEDIQAIDGELSIIFLRQDEAVRWINAIESGIKDWVQKNNKQYWDVVRFVSYKREILGKLKRDKKTTYLTRKDFAKVLVKFCPNALYDEETPNALAASMAHFKHAKIWKDYERKALFGHIARQYIKEVEDLFDGCPQPEPDKKEKIITLEDRVENYLRNTIDNKKSDYPQSIIRIRPSYNDGTINPAISVETYMSEKFLNENSPSQIEAYEFVPDVLQKSKLNEYRGKYSDLKKAKLFIVSTKGLLPEVRVMAFNSNIGYVRLNPNHEMTSEDYCLPRSMTGYVKRSYDLKILEGSEPIKTPFLIMNGTEITSSLSDILASRGVAIKSSRLLSIPFLSVDDIEKKADSITRKDVEDICHMIDMNYLLTERTSIDPFSYVDSLGVKFETEDKQEQIQLGRFDVENNIIILNKAGSANNERYRFTMAHELGHHILHSQLFKNNGITSVRDDNKTMLFSGDISRILEYQANKFASCLLMPKLLVAAWYSVICRLYLGNAPISIYYNPNQRETWTTYNKVVDNMAIRLKVSQQAMQFRLKALKLLRMPE